MRKFARFNLVIAALTLFAPLAANAVEGAESGMITQAVGTVTYESGGDKGKPVVAFMKLRVGDRLTLAKDAKAQLVYFQGGRQETWRGATQIDVGVSESHTASASQPETKLLPALVLQQISRAPKVVADLKNRTGMVFVRALPMREKLRELGETYAAMRKDAAPDDVTPELFMLAGLHELRMYPDMRPVLEEMRLRQPDNPEINTVCDQYGKLMNNNR